MSVYSANDNDITITGLSRESDGSFINDATLTAAIQDASGTQFASGISVPFVAASSGNYRGTIPAGSPPLTPGKMYFAVVTASNYGFSVSIPFLAQTRTA